MAYKEIVMWQWVKNLFTNRYVKSFVRYALTALVGVMLKYEFPGIGELATFLETHLEDLTNIFAALIMGIVALWSVGKNKSNARIKGTK